LYRARILALRYDGVMTILSLGLRSWERTIRAVELVKNRLLRATAALENARIAYAVIGGDAVAAWVGRVDQLAVRFTQDVDLLILRSDLDATKAALETAGFYRHVASVDLFLDGPDAKARDVVPVIFAGERVRPDYALPAPDVTESDPSEDLQQGELHCERVRVGTCYRELAVMEEEEVIRDMESRPRTDFDVGRRLAGSVQGHVPVGGHIKHQVSEWNVVRREVAADGQVAKL
jgi:hypothetical protein